MTNVEKIAQVINDYVNQYGSGAEMTRQELYQMVSRVYPMNINSFLPADSCYNRTNIGIDFEHHAHLFEWLTNGNYRILGKDYPFSGPVYARKRGETQDSIVGYWTSGTYHDATQTVENSANLRLKDLLLGIQHALKDTSAAVHETDNLALVVTSGETEICHIYILPEAYSVSTSYISWSDKTSYLTDVEKDVCSYYVDTTDECIGEIKRLVMFAATI